MARAQQPAAPAAPRGAGGASGLAQQLLRRRRARISARGARARQGQHSAPGSLSLRAVPRCANAPRRRPRPTRPLHLPKIDPCRGPAAASAAARRPPGRQRAARGRGDAPSASWRRAARGAGCRRRPPEQRLGGRPDLGASRLRVVHGTMPQGKQCTLRRASLEPIAPSACCGACGRAHVRSSRVARMICSPSTHDDTVVTRRPQRRRRRTRRRLAPRRRPRARRPLPRPPPPPPPWPPAPASSGTQPPGS